MEDSTTTRFHPIRCPFCKGYNLEQPPGSNSAHCTSCMGSLDAALLSTLSEIQTLPDALGSHPCEACGHPECAACPTDIGGW